MRKVLLAVRVHPQRAYYFRRLVGYWGRSLSDCLDEALGMYLQDAREHGFGGKDEADRMWAKWGEDYRKKYLDD